MDNTPIIITGPPGCGKSYWIQKYAESIQKQLFVCPCRKDRTLRDGRQKLHVWARRTEPALLWLEGADDLTPEAQAFLRRILETHSSNVLFILECRDSGKLQEPIRSRCIIKKISKPSWNDLEQYISNSYKSINVHEIKSYLLSNEYSYRKVKHCIYLQQHHQDIWRDIYNQRINELEILNNIEPEYLIDYIKKGYNPELMINTLLDNKDIIKDYGKCTEISGSLWAFLGSALYKLKTSPNNQEENES
jgi:hypothetical protein